MKVEHVIHMQLIVSGVKWFTGSFCFWSWFSIFYWRESEKAVYGMDTVLY